MGGLLDRLNVKQKIMVSVSVLFIFVMAVLGLVLDGIITDSQMNNFEEEADLQSTQVDNAMDLFLIGLRDGLVNMANDPVLRAGGEITRYMDEAVAATAASDGNIAMDPQAKGGFELAAYQVFQRFGESHKATVSVISYGTTDGGYLQYPAVKRKKGYDSRKRDWFKESMADVSKVRITKPFKTSKGTPTVGIFATVKGMDGQPLGVLGLNIDLPVVTDMISEIKVGETGYIMMLDADGVIIADPKHQDAAFKKLAEAELGELSNLDTAKSLKGLREVNLDGSSKMVNTYVSEKTGYRYLTIVDRSQLMQNVNHMRMILGGVLVVALLLIFAATYFISNLIVSPLRGLQASAERLADGDLRNNQLAVDSDDEIGTLAQSFHKMTTELTTLLKQIKGSADEVSNSSGQMSSGVEQVAETITHVAEQVGDIAEAASHQSETINNVVGNIRQMTEHVNGIADKSANISKTSGMAGVAAKEGVAAIEAAVEQMKVAHKTVVESAANVDELGKSSEQIGEIINTIQSIAEQTNLLALNAAIEAARAGEQGRGFSVVADEVRKLAEQSSEAATEIAQMISGVQQVTKRAVESMNVGTEQVSTSGRTVVEAGEKFRQIASHIEEVDNLVKDAAHSASRVADDSVSVLRDAEDVDETTKQITQNIASISAATEEQSASMEELAASSHRLANMAEELQKESARFKF
ncbi:putative methyl-accepting chemotaxis protein [Selenomonas ruminantium subsp. lactilytica TAM6421]|uniref:Putative methyl-accepting chemotaxis protein n=1 Tax=Selenomonas ruminantium subsp. lactilytica (strain NBRC 103574 / TAM6421) TaxID=927704 RepID=I0GRA9_SELRL|nr:methyl-accepting chemotaxis protein [Selenomonas ruminantium]BAL83296.1 putative methyl-accepting chemotaxis protein [Selenomonas ruminantium subsp. lactilytica TAM6421]